MRYLFYSHDGFGVGHTRRQLAIAAALTAREPRASILLATGAEFVARLGLPPRVDVLKLPSLRKIANGQYVSRRLQVTPEEIRAIRAALLTTAVKSFRPQVALVDKHPFGASGEFRAGLEALRRSGGRALLGLRDILDEPSAVIAEWGESNMIRRITGFFDRVFVYGHQAIYDPFAEYHFPAAIRSKTRFCGYVVNNERGSLTLPELAALRASAPGVPVVLATAGGGEDGFQLLVTFVRAAAGAAWRGMVVAGPMLPDHQLHALQLQGAQCGVRVLSLVPHLAGILDSVDALVCMGGYNTLAEALFAALPTVCVPRVEPRTEQLLRAQALQRLGLLRLAHPRQLNPELLRSLVAESLATPRAAVQNQARAAMGFDGAEQAAEDLVALGEAAAQDASLRRTTLHR